MASTCTAGVIASATRYPWSISECRLFCLDTDAVDSGSPNYLVTSIADQAGGAAWARTAGAGDFTRLSGPGGAFGWFTVPQSTGNRYGRVADAALWNAVRLGLDHSFVFRVYVPSPTGTPYNFEIRDLGVADNFVRFTHPGVTSSTPFRYLRSTSGTTRDHSVSVTTSTGYHTYGVSYVAGSPNSVAHLYTDGVLTASPSLANLALAAETGTVEECVGAPGATPTGRIRAFGAWTGALTAANHLAIHNYLASVTP